LGRLFVISGPSGVGKGSIVSALTETDPRLWLSTSVTTRPQRQGDVEGLSYDFVDQAEFDAMRERGDLLEWARVYGHFYGTPRRAVEEKLAEGFDVILEIDVNGAMQVKERMKEAVTIFVEPPDLAELERRLVERGTDTEDEIRRRLRVASDELAEKDRFDHVVMNDNLESAIAEIRSIIEETRRSATR
jgi:guanylate kinase